MSKIAVLGLGQFGSAVAKHLARLGQEVLAVDIDRASTEEVADAVDAAICMDATDERALTGLELPRYDAVVVAMGSHALESSILTTALLRQGGVSHIIARSTNDLHARVLRAVGAHEIVDPEAQMGQRLAEKLTHPNVIDELELGGAIVAEVEVSTAMVNRSIAQLQIRNRYGATILAVRRADDVDTNPGPDYVLREHDILVVLGKQDEVRKLAKKG